MEISVRYLQNDAIQKSDNGGLVSLDYSVT